MTALCGLCLKVVVVMVGWPTPLYFRVSPSPPGTIWVLELTNRGVNKVKPKVWFKYYSMSFLSLST